ncbi:MAG: histone deacetylase family protein [Firmicutes bacterium]|nr:histone deacetylase family protein [Bacillota bacterium]
MKIVFHPLFLSSYTSDPAAEEGRLEPSWAILRDKYGFVEPEAAAEEDILLVHTKRHLENVRRNSVVFRLAMLAAGATLEAASSAVKGEAAFALCRPPGHHASPDSCWGFCYFNNVAVAVSRLLNDGYIKTAAIVDFDLHYGDGTANIFAGVGGVSYCHVSGSSGYPFVENLKTFLEHTSYDLLAVSAGFDRHAKDWGGMLSDHDYGEIGQALGEAARQKCGGRIFAALEGGYNAGSLATGIGAFLKGLGGSPEGSAGNQRNIPESMKLL